MFTGLPHRGVNLGSRKTTSTHDTLRNAEMQRQRREKLRRETAAATAIQTAWRARTLLMQARYELAKQAAHDATLIAAPNVLAYILPVFGYWPAEQRERWVTAFIASDESARISSLLLRRLPLLWTESGHPTEKPNTDNKKESAESIPWPPVPTYRHITTPSNQNHNQISDSNGNNGAAGGDLSDSGSARHSLHARLGLRVLQRQAPPAIPRELMVPLLHSVVAAEDCKGLQWLSRNYRDSTWEALLAQTRPGPAEIFDRLGGRSLAPFYHLPPASFYRGVNIGNTAYQSHDALKHLFVRLLPEMAHSWPLVYKIVSVAWTDRSILSPATVAAHHAELYSAEHVAASLAEDPRQLAVFTHQLFEIAPLEKTAILQRLALAPLHPASASALALLGDSTVRLFWASYRRTKSPDSFYLVLELLSYWFLVARDHELVSPESLYRLDRSDMQEIAQTVKAESFALLWQQPLEGTDRRRKDDYANSSETALLRLLRQMYARDSRMKLFAPRSWLMDSSAGQRFLAVFNGFAKGPQPGVRRAATAAAAGRAGAGGISARQGDYPIHEHMSARTSPPLFSPPEASAASMASSAALASSSASTSTTTTTPLSPTASIASTAAMASPYGPGAAAASFVHTADDSSDAASDASDPYDDDDYDDGFGGPRLRLDANPAKRVLEYAPFFIPFDTRVLLFSRFVGEDRFVLDGRGPPLGRQHYDIHREMLVEDSQHLFASLGPSIKTEMAVRLLSDGQPEAGIDGGGLTRELLISLCEILFHDEPLNDETPLFVETSDHTLMPNPLFGERPQLLTPKIRAKYLFMGQVVGKCLYENLLIDVEFAPLFLAKWKKSGTRSSFDDLALLDEELYTQLTRFHAMSDSEIEALDLDFTITNSQHDQVLLRKGGDTTRVTCANKLQYLRELAEYKLNTVYKHQVSWFLLGLSQIVKLEWLSLFNPQELNKLISGESLGLDVDDLQRHAVLSGFAPNSATIHNLWAVLREFSNDERAQFLKFVISVPKPPLLGFARLEPGFGIRFAGYDDQRLPTASTCVNLLKLPEYSSKEVLREKLLYSIQARAGFELS